MNTSTTSNKDKSANVSMLARFNRSTLDENLKVQTGFSLVKFFRQFWIINQITTASVVM